jgi:hypothetical protein
MKERPILYSAPMVRAKLEDRKTKTRRTRGLDKINLNPGAWRFDGWISGSFDLKDNGKAVWSPIGNSKYDISGSIKVRCPFGVVTDRLWGKETYRFSWSNNQLKPSEVQKGSATWYECDGQPEEWCGKLRPSIFMPRWASRILDEIVSIRVERLQDITEADAIAEGVYSEPNGRDTEYGQDEHGPFYWTAKQAYRSLWESINGPDSWDLNPWVWVIETRKVVL